MNNNGFTSEAIYNVMWDALNKNLTSQTKKCCEFLSRDITFENDSFIQYYKFFIDYLVEIVEMNAFLANFGENTLYTYQLSNRLHDKFSDVIFQLFFMASVVCNTPNPGNECQICPKFGELFFAAILNLELEQVLDVESVLVNEDTTFLLELRELLSQYSSDAYDILNYGRLLNSNKSNISEVDIDQYIKEKIHGQYIVYEKFKRFRKRSTTKITRLVLLEKLTYGRLYCKVKEAINLYMNCKFTALDKMMTIYHDITSAQTAEAQETIQVVEKKSCRKCGKPESVRKLTACKKCVQDNYPDINYYCGRRCQDARWKSDHMLEHLEFELGVSQFDAVNIMNTENVTRQLEQQLEFELGLGEFFKPKLK